MADIARAAGVSRSTVSRALRDDATIPFERCSQIKRVAEQLGYRPNPLVSTLMAQLHRQRRSGDPDRIAWIDLWPPNDPPPAVSMMKPLLVGAMARANQLGYHIEVHRAGLEPLQPSRLRQILLARSQWGFIIPPVPRPAKHFALEMQGLAGVTIGTSLLEPVMHRVTTNHFQTAQQAWQQLHRKGFRRIGLVLSESINARIDGRWLGGYVAAQVAHSVADALPPLCVQESGFGRFEQWVHEWQPDAILVAEQAIAEWITTIGAHDGPRPAVAWLVLEHGATNAWGMDYQAEKIGAAAVDMVVAQIQRNERGSPSQPHTLLLDSVWAEH
jgi:LacI family transcriptional regulator